MLKMGDYLWKGRRRWIAFGCGVSFQILIFSFYLDKIESRNRTYEHQLHLIQNSIQIVIIYIYI